MLALGIFGFAFSTEAEVAGGHVGEFDTVVDKITVWLSWEAGMAVIFCFE